MFYLLIIIVRMSTALKTFRPVPLEPSDFAGIRDALESDGVCVIQNVLSTSEQEQFLHLFWEAIQRRGKGLKRDDSSTWTEDNTDWYGTFGAGQYKHYGMAQEGHCWHIRKNEIIRRIFEEGVFAKDGKKEDCCVSLDGCAALFRPVKSGLKLHVDAVPDVEGWDWGSVQGAYNLYAVDVSEDLSRANAGFACVVGSHREYTKWWEEETRLKGFKKPTKHWYTIREDSPLQQQVQIILSPANALVLWRSDLLHKNYGGDYTTAELGGGSAETARLARLTQFVTFQPTRYRTEEARLRKAQSVADGVCNNHWAALSFRVPITPFPAWSAASKKIPIKLPFGKQCIKETSAGLEKTVGENDAVQETAAAVDKGNSLEEPATKKRKTGKAGELEKVLLSLPVCIQNLL